MKFVKAICLLCISILTINAKIIPDMVTDRPDQTESPVTVPPGWMQIETGSLFEKDAPTNLTNFTYNTTLVRFGILSNTELRFGGEFLQEKYKNGNSISNTGLSPITIGFKTKLIQETKFIPELAFLGHLTLPYLGEETFTPEYVAPDFRIAGSKTLRNDFSLGFNFGGEWDGTTPETHFFYSTVIGAGMGDKIGLFAELYGYINEESKPDHRFDTGMTFLINPAMQLDLSAGLGINEVAPDYFISGGFSYRFELIK